MALGVTHLINSKSATDASSYTTATFTSTAQRPLLCTIENASATVSATPTVTAHSLTWTQVNSQETDSGAIRRRVTVFKAHPIAGGSGTMAIDFAGATQLHCMWSIEEFTGADVTDIAVQSATDRGSASGGVTVTLAAFGSTNNGTFGAWSINQNSGLTAGGSYSALTDDTEATGDSNSSFLVEFLGSNDTSVDVTIDGGTARRWVGVAVEVKALANITMTLGQNIGF